MSKVLDKVHCSVVHIKLKSFSCYAFYTKRNVRADKGPAGLTDSGVSLP